VARTKSWQVTDVVVPLSQNRNRLPQAFEGPLHEVDDRIDDVGAVGIHREVAEGLVPGDVELGHTVQGRAG